MSSPLQSSGRYLSTQELSPNKEEWAMINNFKVLEFERQKQLERIASIEKKKNFKQQLDNQLSNKSNAKKQERDLDYKYYEQIVRKDQELKAKEEKEKMQKLKTFKKLQQYNYNILSDKNSRVKEQFHSSFDIGYHSELERKKREEKVRREVLDTLDKQLQMKAEERYLERKKSIEQDEANIKYQLSQFEEKGKSKRYQQNQKVYQYYKRLNRQKQKKQREVEQKLIDEAMQKRLEEEDHRTFQKKIHQKQMNNEFKEILDSQVLINQRRKSEEKRADSEENSYSVIGNVFRDKSAVHDKKKYHDYLTYQEQQQLMKKKRENYMNDEQYKYNMNQLNRVVKGDYPSHNYVDRSVANIGQNRRFNMAEVSNNIYDQNAQAVQSKIHNLHEERLRVEEEKKNQN